MVKCNRCGVEIEDSWNICPNCGNDLSQVEEIMDSDDVNAASKCENCGSEIPNNVLFCPTCGNKVKTPKIQNEIQSCPNCGFELDAETTFCPECGSNVFTGETKNLNRQKQSSNGGFVEKINLNNIIVPTILSLIVSIVLSLLGILIGFSWLSFIIAICLSVGFFAGSIDNEANAIVFGLLSGLILGILENPLVEFLYGSFVAGFYEGFFGSHLIILVVLGIVIAYISNIYLKKNIQEIIAKLGISWL